MQGDETPKIGYHAIRLGSWNLARQFGTSSLPSHAQRAGGQQFWCFRGQANASWGLQTTLEREGKRHECPPEFYAEREWRILDEFRRRSHLHGDSQPAGLNNIEWLALIQHHGGPTRLLDFTYSFYVACFFALESAVDDAAVWAVNLSELRRAFVRRDGLQEIQHPVVFSKWALMQCIDALERGSADRAVVLVEPYQMSERLAAQQGLFLFPLNIALPFEKNLAAILELPPGCFAETSTRDYDDGDDLPFETIFHKVLKIVLPREIRKHAMKDLRQMNITSASLFPGLDGFARSLRWYLTP